MREHNVNQLDNFIAGWYIDPSVCDSLLEYYNSSEKREGTVHDSAEGNRTVVKKEAKDSTDVTVKDRFILKYYSDSIQPVVDRYIEKYEYCNTGYPWTIVEGVNIQHYGIGGGYHSWHYERAAANCLQANRHLVFMTYLNDVTDGGETEFYYQKLKVKPEKGLTLIWPADWTFTHRGNPSASQEKYIITGWFNYFS